MNLLSRIKQHLPDHDSVRPLVDSVEIEWHRELDALKGVGVLIIRTKRPLTSDGGDGWHGFDATDSNWLHNAASLALKEEGAFGHISHIIVRAA